MRTSAIVAVLVLSMASLAAADGEESYRTRRALCHGGNAAGSDRAGAILATLDASGPALLARIITWRYAHPRTEGLVGDPGIGLNRGVAVHGDLVFSVTDHTHVIALDRFTGELIWDTEMDDYREHYGVVVAPLVVGDLVVGGISAGDTGCAVSSTPTTPRRASARGASGPFPRPGSRDRRPGATRRCCAGAAAPPG